MPFVVGALELYLDHTITQGMSFWLLGLAGIAAMGAVGTWYMHWRARTEAGNDQLLRYLRRHHLLFALYYAGGAAFLLLLAWANSVGGWEAAEGGQGVLAVGTALMVGVCLSALTPTKWERGLPKEKKRRTILSKDLCKAERSSFS